MAFTVKDWKDLPDTTTPISASALEDMETRLSNYTDTAGGLTGSPGDSAANLVTAQAPDARPMTLRGAASQSAEHFRVETSTGSPIFTVGSIGNSEFRSSHGLGSALNFRQSTDTHPRAQINFGSSPTLLLGNGAGLLDVTLARTGASQAELTGNLKITPSTNSSTHLVEMRSSTPATGHLFNTAGEAFTSIFAKHSYNRTDPALATDPGYYGIASNVAYGYQTGGSKGTIHCFTASETVNQEVSAENEHCAYFGVLRYDQTTGPAGSVWFTDYNVHSAIGIRHRKLNGISMFMNNHYNGEPITGPATGVLVSTWPGNGGAASAEHRAATTYQMGIGLQVAGKSGTTGTPTGVGWATGIKVGGAASAWATSTKVGKAIQISDYMTHGIEFVSVHPDATNARAITTNVFSGLSNFAGGLATRWKSSAPNDADYTDPPDGLMVIANVSGTVRLYARSNGEWFYHPLSAA